jgi:hypothetical protein
MARIHGGDKFEEVLARIARLTGGETALRVGFLENARYPDGTPVGMVAAIQDFGAPRAGIPPRPFFRNMIATKHGEWPKAIAALLKTHHYDVAAALDEAGAAIAGQLRQSIVDTNSPPLKPATIRRKGFAKPLVDTGHMLNSIDHEVERA